MQPIDGVEPEIGCLKLYPCDRNTKPAFLSALVVFYYLPVKTILIISVQPVYINFF